MSEDLLVLLHRQLGAAVDAMHLRPAARRVFHLLVRARYGAAGLAVARQNGRVWRLDFEVARRGLEQEMDTIQWLRTVLQDGGVGLDIGANVGQMTLEMAELVGPKGRVFAVEPAPGNLRLLRRHIEANGFLDRVCVLEAACVDTDGVTVTLGIVSGNRRSDSVGSGHAIVGAGTRPPPDCTVAVNVPGVTIDAIVERERIAPRAIKIDVEGSELRVLQGARRTLIEHRPHLRVAFHPFAFEDPRAGSDAILTLLRTHGYVVDLQGDEAMCLAEYNCMPA